MQNHESLSQKKIAHNFDHHTPLNILPLLQLNHPPLSPGLPDPFFKAFAEDFALYLHFGFHQSPVGVPRTTIHWKVTSIRSVLPSA